MNKILTFVAAATLSFNSFAADYVIDTKGAHASINFKVNHAGFSWLTGRFNKFSGNFSYDANNVEASTITVNIDPDSVDSNHAKRDKHLRSDDFLDVSKYASAKFVSTKVVDKGNGKLEITGDLTLRNVTNSIVIDAVKIGEGKRRGKDHVGFAGTTKFTMKDFGIPKNLGPASQEVYLDLHIEGIRQ